VTPKFSMAPILLPVTTQQPQVSVPASVSSSSSTSKPSCAEFTSEIDLIVTHTVHVLWTAVDEFCCKPACQARPQAACWAGCRRPIHTAALLASRSGLLLPRAVAAELLQTLSTAAAYWS
jgi:hypothetical protein